MKSRSPSCRRGLCVQCDPARGDLRLRDWHRLELHECRPHGHVHPAALATGTTAPTITVVVTAPGAGRDLTNTVTVSVPSTADPNPANNTSSVITTVTASADLSIVKTGPATVVAGGQRHLLAGRRQRGPVGRGEPARCTDTLPAGVTFVSATGTGWTCTQRGERVGDLHPADPGHRCDGADDHDRRHGAGAGRRR